MTLKDLLNTIWQNQEIDICDSNGCSYYAGQITRIPDNLYSAIFEYEVMAVYVNGPYITIEIIED